MENGLSNNAVTCIIQDQKGFMWFGTRDGVNRFDGQAFKVYRFNNRGQSSSSNFVHAIHLDNTGRLLVATDNNVYRYNPLLDSFVFVFAVNVPLIDELALDGEGNIWLNAGYTLFRYAEKTGRLTTFHQKQYFSVSSIASTTNGVLWMATPNSQLKQYRASDSSFSSYPLFMPGYKGPRFIQSTKMMADNKLLVGIDKAGVKVFDTQTGKVSDITLCCETADNLFIRSLLQVSPTEIWIGTETGLFIYNPQNGQSKKIAKQSTDPFGLSDNVIYSLYKDREGGIWVGTYFGGINYYPKQFTPFRKYYNNPFENSLNGNIVREITGDKYGNIWVGSEDGGLNQLDTATGIFRHYMPHSGAHSLACACIHDLLAVDNELWVGTYEHGLDIFNINTRKVTRHYNASPVNGLRSNFPFCMLQTTKGEIIVGTANGIYSYNRRKNYFENIEGFPPNDWYMCIYNDAKGTLWAGIPGKGIYFVNRHTGASGHYSHNPANPNSIASDKVNSIFEDSQHNLWFATENGLSKWNASQRHFKNYGTKDGFPSDFMLAMLEDDNGRLWISTTKGLACFNPQTTELQVYTTANGLLSDQFNFSSAYKDNSGRMYFGSARGMISFKPTQFVTDRFVPPVYLTSLLIDNQPVGIHANNSPLEQALMHTNELVLHYNQSSFGIKIAATGYTAPQTLQYAYMLQGLSDKWTFLQAPGTISFTKLKPGRYTFRVKASSTAGNWGEEETQLQIRILPPWWLSGWAYLAYFIFAIALIWYLVHSYHQRVEERNRKKIELLQLAKTREILQVEIAKEKEMLESKITFLTHVAHEIRTPLTLIKIPLARAIRKTRGNPEVEESLEMVDQNAGRLVDLANQILDFRKTEISKFNLTLVQVDVVLLVSQAYNSYQTLAGQKHVTMQLNLPSQPMSALADAEALNKIVFNLLSNAVKYAHTKVIVDLLPAYKSPDTFSLRVQNNGPLIPAPLQHKIFEPFYRLPETEMQPGSGIGLSLALSLAQLHNGTLTLEPPANDMNVFLLTLPVRAHTLLNQQAQPGAAGNSTQM